MRHAFSNVLYYPTIDIKNTNWLKTAVLFWDSISTIVPASLKMPYRKYETQYLADIGLLRPLIVSSEDKSVVGIENDILELIFTTEFYHTACAHQSDDYAIIFRSKMSYLVIENLRRISKGHRHIWEIEDKFERFCNSDDRSFYCVDNEFAYVYMVALANKLCDDYSLGMVTDEIPCFDFGNTVRFGNQTSILPEDRFLNRRPKEHQFEHGLLLNYIISGLSISPDAELPDIIHFKEHHADELGRFRTQLAKLTQELSTDKTINALQNEISDIYRNEFVPAFEDLKAALKCSRIKWFTDNFLKVTTMSVGTFAVPFLLGMPVEQSVFAGAGVSVISSAISYNADKKNALRNNPYSYLLSIKREW